MVGAVAQLNSLAGEYPTIMGGNAGFAKLDFNLSLKQLLFFRLSTSRYSGINNVFFDPASPITSFTEDNNGTEDVKTESMASSWTSVWTNRWSTNLRAQFSRDMQQSFANSEAAKIKIYGIVDGMGRSKIMPRENTRAHAAYRRHCELQHRAQALEVWRGLSAGLDLQLLSCDVRRRVLFRQRQGESVVFHANEVWRAADAATRACALRAPLLHAGFRRCRIASQFAVVLGVLAGHDTDDAQPDRKCRRALRSADI